MENFGTEMIAPNRARRSQTQDGRPLRRYVRRWKVERMFAWLFNFRRLIVRYEYHIENFRGFLHLAAGHPPQAFMRWLLVVFWVLTTNPSRR